MCVACIHLLIIIRDVQEFDIPIDSIT